MTAPPDDLALRQRCLDLALPKSASVTGALMAAADMYRWLKSGELPGHIGITESEQADRGYSGAGRATALRDPASSDTNSAAAPRSQQPEPEGVPQHALGVVAEPHSPADGPDREAGPPSPPPCLGEAPDGEEHLLAGPIHEIDGGVEGHAVDAVLKSPLSARGDSPLGISVGSDRHDRMVSASVIPTDAPVGIKPGPSIPTTESGAATSDTLSTLSVETKASIIAGYKNGASMKALAHRFGTSVEVIRRVLQKSRDMRSRYIRWTDELITAFRTDWDAAMPLQDLATKYNMTRAAILLRAKALGLDKVRRKEARIALASAGASGSMEGDQKDLGDVNIVAQNERTTETQPIELQTNSAESTKQYVANAASATHGIQPDSMQMSGGEVEPSPGPDDMRSMMRANAAAPHSPTAAAVLVTVASEWPLPKRAFVIAGWKAGKSFSEIAEDATASGYRTTAGQVREAVAQLGLQNDPDRIAARSRRGMG